MGKIKDIAIEAMDKGIDITDHTFTEVLDMLLASVEADTSNDTEVNINNIHELFVIFMLENYGDTVLSAWAFETAKAGITDLKDIPLEYYIKVFYWFGDNKDKGTFWQEINNTWQEYLLVNNLLDVQEPSTTGDPSTSDGTTASYYKLPNGATQLQDLISYKNMNAQVGEAFRSLYRYGESSHSDKLRDARKVLFYMEAEIKRLEMYGN